MQKKEMKEEQEESKGQNLKNLNQYTDKDILSCIRKPSKLTMCP